MTKEAVQDIVDKMADYYRVDDSPSDFVTDVLSLQAEMMAQLEKDIATSLQSYVGMPLTTTTKEMIETTKEMIENSLRASIVAVGLDPRIYQFDIELK